MILSVVNWIINEKLLRDRYENSVEMGNQLLKINYMKTITCTFPLDPLTHMR